MWCAPWYHRTRHLPLTGRMRPAVAMVALADGERTCPQGLDPEVKIAPPADGYSPRR
jgi:hypothetical protein